MTEENETEEVQQVAEPVAEQTEQQPQATESVPEPQAPRRDADRNWENVHQLLGQQKAELESLRAELQKKNAPLEVPEKDELADLDPNDYIPVAKAQKWAQSMKESAKKEAREAAKQAAEEVARQHAVAFDEQRTKAAHDDYDYVVENFAIPLIKNDPALAHKVMMSKSPAETAYKLGKLADAYEEQMTQQKPSPKAEKILKNSQRPTSSNAVSSSLKSQADKFSKMTPAEIWSESQKYARSA